MKELLPDTIRPIRFEDGTLFLLDQRLLPQLRRENAYRDATEVAAAIRDMVVRGAPAIGITAAFGVVLACQAARDEGGGAWRTAVDGALDRLAASRPTAVNLFWALDRMRGVLDRCKGADEAVAASLAAARRMLADDI